MQVAGQAPGPLGERRLEAAGGGRHNPQGLIEPFGAARRSGRAARRRRGGRSGDARRARTARRPRAPARRPARCGPPASAARAASSSTSSRSSRRRASSSRRTASAVSPANHSSPRSGSQPIPSAVTAVTFDASSSSRGTHGHVHELARVAADEHEHRAEAGRPRLLDQLEPAGGMRREHGRGAMSERGCRRALCARLDLEQLQRELLALLGERTRGGREPFALRERLLERDEAFPREADARLEILLFAHRRAGGGIGVVGQAAQLGGRRAGGHPARVGQLRAAAPRADAAPTRAGRPSVWVAPRRASSASRPPPVSCDSVSARRASTSSSSAASVGLRGAFDRGDARPASFGLDLQARALRRRRLGGRRRVARGGLEPDRRRRVVGPRSLELGAQRRAQGRGRLAAQRDAARRRCAAGRAPRSPVRGRRPNR